MLKYQLLRYGSVDMEDAAVYLPFPDIHRRISSRGRIRCIPSLIAVFEPEVECARLLHIGIEMSEIPFLKMAFIHPQYIRGI